MGTTKRAAIAPRTTAAVPFRAKAASNGDVVIEGWANRAVVDRGKDILPRAAWKLQNYAKSPMILFNHDRDTPIGKAIAVEARDEGLYIKCVLSKSDDPKIKMVRELIQEGILNAFSVGFEAKDEQRDAEGINTIKDAELYEVSVVTLPQNQDSLFSLTTKSMPTSLGAARIATLRAKGAKLAEAIQAHLNELEGKDPNYNRNEALQKVATTAGGSVDEARAIISGEPKAVSEQWIKAFASGLGMDAGALAAAAKADEGTAGPEQNGKAQPPPNEPAAASGDPAGQQEPPAEGEQQPPPPKEKEQPAGVAIYAVLVPKEQAATAEDAGAWCEQNGWVGGVVEDMGDAWGVVQADPELFASKDFAELDMGGGVVALIGATAPGDEETAEGDDAAAEGEPKEAPPPATDDEMKAQAKAVCDDCMARYVKEGLDHGKAQDQATAYAMSMCEKECGSAKEAPATTETPMDPNCPPAAKARKSTGQGPTTPVADASSGSMGDSNPVLDAARQTNVLLGTLIEAVRALATKIEGMAPKPQPAGSEQPPPPVAPAAAKADEGDVMKSIEALASAFEKCDERLKRVGA